MRTLTVTRKGYQKGPWVDRYGHHHEGKWIPPTTYEIKDVGAPGRGRKTLPPIREPGKMTAIANEMGYDFVTEISDSDIPEFVDKLVRRYGQQSAQGMIRWQINIRKNTPGHAKRWFELADRTLRAEYAGGGWD